MAEGITKDKDISKMTYAEACYELKCAKDNF